MKGNMKANARVKADLTRSDDRNSIDEGEERRFWEMADRRS